MGRSTGQDGAGSRQITSSISFPIRKERSKGGHLISRPKGGEREFACRRRVMREANV